MPREPREQSDQRRLIYIAPGEMLTTGNVVELVAKKTIVANAGKLEKQFRDGQARQNGRGAQHSLAGASRCERAPVEFVDLSLAHAGWEITQKVRREKYRLIRLLRNQFAAGETIVADLIMSMLGKFLSR